MSQLPFYDHDESRSSAFSTKRLRCDDMTTWRMNRLTKPQSASEMLNISVA